MEPNGHQAETSGAVELATGVGAKVPIPVVKTFPVLKYGAKVKLLIDISKANAVSRNILADTECVVIDDARCGPELIAIAPVHSAERYWFYTNRHNVEPM